MTSWIVYNGLHKIFRYEMTQHGDIEEPLDDLKSYHTPSKENSEKIDYQKRKKTQMKALFMVQMIIYQKNH